MEELPLGRKRHTYPGHVVARQAKAIAGPSQDLLSKWHGDVARLLGMATRRDTPDREYVSRLRRQISAAQLDFRQSRIRAGEAAEHSLLRDIDRSYASLLEQLQALDRDDAKGGHI
jgi:hypothetical protein